MSDRKLTLKQCLGLSEWSSDDDEAPVPQQERNPPDDALQRTLVPRPSITDTPGTSGVQQQSDPASPATARKIQNNMDRDLFWSIINHNPRTNNIPQSNRPMISDTPGASVRATNLNTHVTPSRSRSDVRLPDNRTASRRLERRLHSIDMLGVSGVKHHGQHNVPRSRPYAGPSNASNNTSRTTPRGPDPPDRSPSPPDFHSSCDNPYDGTRIQRYVQQLMRSNSNSNNNSNNRDANAPWRPPSNYPTSEVVRAMALRRIQPNVVFIDNPRSEEPANPCHNDGPSTSQPAANPCRLDGPSNSQVPANPCRLDGPSTSQAPAEPYRRFVRDGYINVEEESVPGVNVSQATNQNVEQLDQVNANVVAETDEEITPPESGSVGMIEEVFDLGAPNGTDNNPPPSGTETSEQGNTETPAENNGNTAAVNSDESLESPQKGSSYGVKRKRDANDESGENYTIQEFNQSLLRLLECPVCLEWIEPPMSQCRRGHLVCSRCRARLANCPVCRTPFSSVRNRAMEGVAEMVRYPCRHGCGREVRLRRRGTHEASCAARRYLCPAPACARLPPLPRHELPQHFQSKHLSLLKIGCKHKFSMKVNSEQHDTWLIMALDECFYLRVDVDIRTWGVIVYVAYLGPKKNASSYKYEVTVLGQRNSRKLTYSRSTHSDLESSSVNVSRQDCFHLTLDQALNFLRLNNRHCEPDKFLDFDVEITKWESVGDNRDDSES